MRPPDTVDVSEVIKPLSEKQFQAQVVELAETLNWLVYHPYDSRRSAAGFPDLTMVRNGRLVFAELKSEKGRVTSRQTLWQDELNFTEANAYLWRPSDWDTIVAALS